MPTILTHAVIGAAIPTMAAPKSGRLRITATAICCACVADLDAAGLAMGIPYASFWGHRGFFHSPFWSILLAWLLAFIFYRKRKRFSRSWWQIVCLLTAAGMTHPLLDTLTHGGLGVALLAPFSETRFSFGWQPIPAAPIRADWLFSADATELILTEILVLWIPAWILVGLVRLWTDLHRSSQKR